MITINNSDNSDVYYEIAGFRCLDRISHQCNDIYLTRCGIQQCSPTHTWGPKIRHQYHMHFILNGYGYLEINGEKYALGPGKIFLIPPDTIAHYYVDSKDPWHYAFISFLGDKAEQYLQHAGFADGNLIRDCNIPPEEFSTIIQSMLDAHQLTITNDLKRIGLLFMLFSLLTESTGTGVKSSVSTHDYGPETYLEHALQYIQLNYNRNIHITDISDYIGITRSYLCRIFNKELHQSPQKYLLNYRMEKAKSYLSTSSAPIKDIAAKVGYEDSLAFSKMFYNIVGVSPKVYRQEHYKSS